MKGLQIRISGYEHAQKSGKYQQHEQSKLKEKEKEEEEEQKKKE